MAGGCALSQRWRIQGIISRHLPWSTRSEGVPALSNRIPQDFVAELLARTDIVEIIGRRVSLKRSGREFSACCPFHDEKTPSFTVSPAKQFYHCFGCGEHGSAITFLMQHDHMGFIDAVEELAAVAGLEVPRSGGPHSEGPSAELYDLTSTVMAWYRQCLTGSEAARNYLHGRGVDGATADTFLLGYAPNAWDGVIKRFGTTSSAVRHLLDAGLIKSREGDDKDGHYDRFRDRLMFPIRDARGRVIGFGGRLISTGDGKQPKYLNSPETRLFHKGRELYGMYEMRRAMRNIHHVLVVEGYMDVIALHQQGIANAVATLGTSTTGEHLKRLFRVADEVVFCFDGDRAGRDAAWRALENALPEVREGRQLRFLFLPDGQDPDSLVRQEGAEAFGERVGRAVPLSRFLIQQLSQGLDLDTVDGRARLAELARARVAKVPEGVYRDLLIGELAAAVGLAPDILQRRIPLPPADASADGSAVAPPSERAAPSRARPRRAHRGEQVTPVQRALRLVLNYPAIAAQSGDTADLANLTLAGAELLGNVIEFARNNPDIVTATLVECWRDDPIGRHLGRLAGEAPTRESLGLGAEAGEDAVAAAAAANLRYWLEEIRRAALIQRKELLEAKPLAELTPEEKRELLTLVHQARRETASEPVPPGAEASTSTRMQ
jgi:DNA primase